MGVPDRMEHARAVRVRFIDDGGRAWHIQPEAALPHAIHVRGGFGAGRAHRSRPEPIARAACAASFGVPPRAVTIFGRKSEKWIIFQTLKFCAFRIFDANFLRKPAQNFLNH